MSQSNDTIEVIYRGARHHRAGGNAQRWLWPALAPASWLYQSASSAVRHLRSLDIAPTPAGTTVVSVGNLEVGGNAKTPMAMHLVERLSERGSVAYVSRGFGGRAAMLGGVTVVPPSAVQPRESIPDARIIERPSPLLLDAIGDEGAMVAVRLPNVPMILARSKAKAVEAAARLFDPDYIVMDDAFQSWDTARDVDIVMLNASLPFGNRRLVPAGRLRESPEALERADVIVLDGIADEDALAVATDSLHAQASITAKVIGVRRELDIVRADGEVNTPENALLAVSGIGRPQRFEQGLRENNVPLGASVRYPDHAAYRAEDAAWLDALRERRGLDGFITTEKDWVKLETLGTPAHHTWIARLRLHTIGGDPTHHIKKKPRTSSAASRV